MLDKLYKAVMDQLKDKSPIAREIFRICYERKRASYEGGHMRFAMNL